MSARDLVEQRFRLWASLLRYNIHKADFSWKEDVLVYELSQNYPLVLDSSVKAIHKGTDIEPAKIDSETDKILVILTDGNLDERSKDLIMGALKLHSEAVSANTE